VARRSKGFTLVEILVTVVVIAALAALAIPKLLNQVHKAQEAEAINNLGAIRSAEITLQNLTGKFAAASDELAIKSLLGLAVGGNFYKYQIVDAGGDNFLALAIPTGPLSDWLDEKAIDKDGWRDPGTYTSGGSGGSSGGSSGGGSGGGSGGSSGGSSGSSSGSSGSSGSNWQEPSVGYGITHGSVGGEQVAVDPDTTTDPTMPYPTNVTLTPNDGWIHIGWDPGATGDYTIVYRAEKVNGVVGDFLPVSAATPNDGWSDQVANGTEYCYQSTSYNPDTLTESEPSSPVVCTEADANSPAALAAVEAQDSLEVSVTAITGADGVTSGEQLVQWDVAAGVPILYGSTNCSLENGQEVCVEGYFDPNTNTIILGEDYVDDPQGSAVVLAHESLHAIWYDDYAQYEAGVPGHPQYGIPPNPPGGVRSGEGSIDQEYQAFLTGLQVYFDLKKRHGMSDSSSWDAILPLFLNTTTGSPLADDTDAKAYLRSLYTDLPEY
jgi:prepilin-type N-terminal cleavage/methylation domain-containing protein